MRRFHPFVPAAIAAGVLLAPTAAQATTRFVAPTGSGSACTAGSPCAIAQGINGAAAGDEVRVFPGSYTVNERMDTQPDVTVRGTSSAADTIITSTVSAAGQPGLWLAARSSLSDVTIRRNAGGTFVVYATDGARIERAVVEALAGGGQAIRLGPGGTIRIDSTVAYAKESAAILASGPSASADGEIHARLVNVTAVSDIIAALSVGSGTNRASTVEVVDSIIAGAGAADLRTNQNGQSAFPAKVLLRNSFVRLAPFETAEVPPFVSTPIDRGGNSPLAPVFVDRAGRDLRPAAGSPTIDASPTLLPSLALDVLQRPRLLGAGLDAGAYEYLPAPTALAAEAQTLGAAGATIAATFNAGGLGGKLRVQYGPTTAYGQVTPDQDTVGGATTAAVPLTGLPAGQVVHYRAVLETPGGTVTTPDLTFTVPASTVPAPTPSPAPGAATPITISKLGFKRGVATFTLSAKGVVRVQVLSGKKVRGTVWIEGKAGRNTVRLGSRVKGRVTVRVAAASALSAPSSVTVNVTTARR